MKRIYLQEDLNSIQDAQFVLLEWTAVIPAAGIGSRLNSDLPKPLYPILAKPMIHWIIDLFKPYCGRFVFVLSPAHRSMIEKSLNEILPRDSFDVVLQEEPKGMADAVLKAKEKVKSRYAMVAWSDQITLRSQTISACLRAYMSQKYAKLVLPTVVKSDPYIHLRRDKGDRIIEVLQAREGEISFPEGENDCGLFLFDSAKLFSVLEEGRNEIVAMGNRTQEFNLLPLIPRFDEGANHTISVRTALVEETLGVNTPQEALRAEEILLGRQRLKVAIFAGGRGSATIIEALLRHPQISLTILVNTYDDGLSTGKLRNLIPGMLGPSDIRKNLSRILRDDPSGRALQRLIDFRFPEKIGFNEALSVLEGFREFGLGTLVSCLDRETAESFSRFVGKFVEYVRAKGTSFEFGDCSLGNILFAGAYLESARDFNRAVDLFNDFCKSRARVINISDGTNLVLSGLKEDKTLLKNEAELVSQQNTTAIDEIFLMEKYLSPEEIDLAREKSVGQLKAMLEALSRVPQINTEAQQALLDADIIIYGPGTQHSSLFPSYLTKGVAEAIADNMEAEKIFIGNIHKDHEIQKETANSLTRKLIYYLSRKDQLKMNWGDVVTRFFFQVPEGKGEADRQYVDFITDEFSFPMNSVVLTDWEMTGGVHSGGRVLDELLALVGDRLKRKWNPEP